MSKCKVEERLDELCIQASKSHPSGRLAPDWCRRQAVALYLQELTDRIEALENQQKKERHDPR